MTGFYGRNAAAMAALARVDAWAWPTAQQLRGATICNAEPVPPAPAKSRQVLRQEARRAGKPALDGREARR